MTFVSVRRRTRRGEREVPWLATPRGAMQARKRPRTDSFSRFDQTCSKEGLPELPFASPPYLVLYSYPYDENRSELSAVISAARPGEGHLPSISDYHTISGRGQRLSAQAFLSLPAHRTAPKRHHRLFIRSSVSGSSVSLEVALSLNSCAGSACGTDRRRRRCVRYGDRELTQRANLLLFLSCFFHS